MKKSGLILVACLTLFAAPCYGFENPDGKPGTTWLDLGGAFSFEGSTTFEYERPGGNNNDTTNEVGGPDLSRKSFGLGFGIVAGPRVTLQFLGDMTTGRAERARVIEDPIFGGTHNADEIQKMFSLGVRMRFYFSK